METTHLKEALSHLHDMAVMVNLDRFSHVPDNAPDDDERRLLEDELQGRLIRFFAGQKRRIKSGAKEVRNG